MFTINLNDPAQLSRENVAKLIGSQLDTQNWQLRVSKQGIAFLSAIVGSLDLEDVAFRFETWGVGNNYVGFQAAHDEKWVDEIYNDLLKNWPNPQASFIDR
jgi:hypothetical protein